MLYNEKKIMFVNFRKSLAKKLFDKKVKSNISLNMHKANSILFLRYDDKIGDMVVSTLLYREIKKQYPNIKIYVLCGKNSKEIIKNSPYIHAIYIYNNNFLKDIFVYKQIRKENIDLVVDFIQFRLRPKQLFLLRMINSKFLIGFNKSIYNIYNLSIECDTYKTHISKRYEILLNKLGIFKPLPNYDIFLNENFEEISKRLFKNNKNIIINPISASRHRSFSLNKLNDLIANIHKMNVFKIFIICQKKYKHLFSNIKNTKCICCSSILETASFIKNCDIVISPDTSIVHICNAFNKKLVSLYLDYSNQEEKINIVWAPNYNNAIQLLSKTNDINSIDNLEIIKALKSLM